MVETKQSQSRLAKLAANYNLVLDYFMPPAAAGDNNGSRKQARMFLISHTLGPIIGNSVPLALFVLDPTPGYPVAILALAITSFWAFCFALKAGWDYDRLVFGSVIVLDFTILWSCYHYGGISSPTLPWLLIIPILSLFYVGGEKRLQGRLLFMGMIAFSLFLAIHILWPMPPHDVPAVALSSLGVVSTIAALCYVATMATYYSNIFDAGVALQDQIHMRMEATHEMQQAVIDADAASRVKTEFLARMSHEVRTPLNAVIGYGELLREEFDEEGDEGSIADVDRIDEAARYLLRLVNTILDLSKLEAGRINFHIEQQPISNLFDKLADACGAFLENSARFTESGIVTVSARPAPHDADVLELAVSDTGSGMEPEALKNLLDGNGDPTEASNGRYGGTGVSLLAARALVEAMGGELEASSRPNVGTTFTMRFSPAGAVKPREDHAPVASTADGGDTAEPLVADPLKSAA